MNIILIDFIFITILLGTGIHLGIAASTTAFVKRFYFREKPVPPFIKNQVFFLERTYRLGSTGTNYTILLKVREINRSKNYSIVSIIKPMCKDFTLEAILNVEGYELGVKTSLLEIPKEIVFEDIPVESLSIDSILEKVKKHGQESLSEAELEFLRKNSENI